MNEIKINKKCPICFGEGIIKVESKEFDNWETPCPRCYKIPKKIEAKKREIELSLYSQFSKKDFSDFKFSVFEGTVELVFQTQEIK